MTDARHIVLFLNIAGLTLLAGCTTPTTPPPSLPLPPPVTAPDAPPPEPQPAKPQIQHSPAPLDQIGIFSALVTHLHRWEGTRHALGGTSRRGIDCSAYTQRVYKELFDIPLPRSSAAQAKLGKKVKRTQLQVGDLLFFAQKRRIDHVGIYLGDNTFMHVGSKYGVGRARLDRGYWKPYFREARRLLPCSDCQ